MKGKPKPVSRKTRIVRVPVFVCRRCEAAYLDKITSCDCSASEPFRFIRGTVTYKRKPALK